MRRWFSGEAQSRIDTSVSSISCIIHNTPSPKIRSYILSPTTILRVSRLQNHVRTGLSHFLLKMYYTHHTKYHTQVASLLSPTTFHIPYTPKPTVVNHTSVLYFFFNANTACLFQKVTPLFLLNPVIQLDSYSSFLDQPYIPFSGLSLHMQNHTSVSNFSTTMTLRIHEFSGLICTNDIKSHLLSPPENFFFTFLYSYFKPTLRP